MGKRELSDFNMNILQRILEMSDIKVDLIRLCLFLEMLQILEEPPEMKLIQNKVK